MTDVAETLLHRLRTYSEMPRTTVVEISTAEHYWEQRIQWVACAWNANGRPNMASVRQQGFGWIENYL